MADKTSIEWTDATWNPIRARNLTTQGVGHFCVHVSDGCRNCYAERVQPRFRNPIRFAAQDQRKVKIFLDEKVLTQPLRWKRPRKIFVGSMTDLFGDWVTDDTLDSIFAIMAFADQHIFQVLTKRPERMLEYLLRPDKVELFNQVARWPLPNVWLGVSVEDQTTADQRIPILLHTPAAIRFISAEPLLGPVLMGRTYDDKKRIQDYLTGENGVMHFDGPNFGDGPKIDWVIAGGESGPQARPSHPDWFRSIRDQCQAAGVPFLFKQWGTWLPGENLGWPLAKWQDGNEGAHPSPDHIEWRHFTRPGEYGAFTIRVGKKAAGRLLDGVEYNGFPS